jgi:hypothetical protein
MNIIDTVGTTDRARGLASVGKGNEAGSHEVFSFGVVHIKGTVIYCFVI